MKAKTVEDLLNDQLALCVAATGDCLTQSRLPREDDEYGHLRRNDLAYVAKLMKASARLTEALAQLRGERSQTIHVRRSVDKGGEPGPAKGPVDLSPRRAPQRRAARRDARQGG